MNYAFRPLLLAGLLWLAGCADQPTAPATTNTPAAAQPAAATERSATRDSHATATVSSTPPLLLISIDGYRADYLDRGFSPTLNSLALGGVRAVAMEPSFPSLTFPNHYTLITGLRPDHHGIVNNTMSDPALGRFSLGDRKAVSDGRWWNEGEPLWTLADAHGLKTATMFWPGAEADIHGAHPDHWMPYDGRVTPDQRVDQVLAWLDLPPAQRPQLLTLYFDAVDHAGHEFGPDSPEVNQAIAQTDAAMTRLVAGLTRRGLLDRINLIVVSDHGMASTPADHNVLIDKLIPMDRVETVSLGVLAGFNPRPGHDFKRIEQRLTGTTQAHMQCWDKADIPARFVYGHNPRVPQLVCLAQTGWRITTTSWLIKHQGKLSLGDHGYDNADPLMRALFVAHGPAFRQGVVVPEFANVDVYPLMAHLLGLPPSPNDGHLQDVAGMLRPSAP